MISLKNLREDLKGIFALAIIGGFLVIVDAAFNLSLNEQASGYSMIFPFLSGYSIHFLLSLGGLISGTVMVFGTVLVILSSNVFSLFNKYSTFVSISAMVLDVIAFPAGGGFIIGFVLVLIASVWLLLGPKQPKSSRNKSSRKTNPTSPTKLNLPLSKEEKLVWKILQEKKGTILQSRLIDATGFSKVKITRILNSLEKKGLTERRRLGMSNVVINKKQN